MNNYRDVIIVMLVIIYGTLITSVFIHTANTSANVTTILEEHLAVEKQNTELIITALNAYKKKYKVKATMYNATKKQCDATPHVTAIMTTAMPGRTIAVSRDLNKLLGHKVLVPGFGVRVVEDLMNERYTSRIDILVKTKKEAIDFGVKDLELIILD